MKKNKPPIIDIIESAIANLQLHEQEINDLNVFPIPDGDTGSNMLSTLLSAWNNISENSQTDIDILRDFSKGALLGARGNSGVIISQIIKGFYEGVKKNGNVFSQNDVISLKLVLSESKKYAYNSVSNPVEGTILSVIKSLSENFNIKEKNILNSFRQIHKIAIEATKNTPNQLEILKEAQVVDSGAMGLTFFIEGILSALEGRLLKIKSSSKKSSPDNKNEKFIKADPIKNIGYCTEFILTLKNPESFNKDNFKKELEEINGNSIVMIVEDDILKVHVHVKKPGDAFNIAQKYGEFSNIKSDNMATQARESGHFVDLDSAKFNSKKKKVDKLSIIAISNGVGIDNEFRELGVDYIISGGQTMNPSVNDFMKIINKIDNDNILILPNNSNIILTAEIVQKNIKDKNIFLLPTKTILQGIVALYNINKEMIKFNDFKDSIVSEIKSIREAEISVANKNITMNDVEVKKGNYISISDKKVISSDISLEKVIYQLLEKKFKDGIEIITFFYNDDLNDEKLKKLKKEIDKFKNKYNDDVEIELKYGGQKVYTVLVLGE